MKSNDSFSIGHYGLIAEKFLTLTGSQILGGQMTSRTFVRVLAQHGKKPPTVEAGDAHPLGGASVLAQVCFDQAGADAHE